MRQREIIMVGRWRPDSANGVDKTIVNLTRQLATAGYRLTLWTPSSRFSAIRKVVAEDGVQQYELPISPSGLLIPRATRHFIREYSASFCLVHFHSVFTPYNNLIAARLNCPYALTPNGGYAPAAFDRRTALKKRLFLWLCERAYLERAAFVHVLSEQEKQDIRKLCRQTNFIIAPNGITATALDLEKLRALASDSRAPSPRTLLFLGRLAVHHKGLDQLVEAFAKVAGPSDKLVLAGPDFRHGKARLQHLAKSLRVQDRVTFPGAVYGEDKWRMLASAEVFVHLSRWEGIPFAVLEAMALGKPVLVSTGTNLADYVKRYNAGWVSSVEATAAVQDCLRAPVSRLKERGANAQRLIEAEFQWGDIARKVMVGYQRYCG